MIDHAQRTGFTSGTNPFESARQHADAVGQKRTVGGIVNVGFHRGGVGAQLAARSYRLFFGDLDDSIMDLDGALGTQGGKNAAETRKMRNWILEKASKAPV